MHSLLSFLKILNLFWYNFKVMHRLIIYYTPKWKNLLRLRATQNALQLLFFLSLFSALFLDGLPKFFSERCKISYLGSVWRRSDSFLGHTKKYLRKSSSRNCYSWRVWHMARLIHSKQHSQLPKKAKETARIQEKVGWLVDDRKFKDQNKEK